MKKIIVTVLIFGLLTIPFFGAGAQEKSEVEFWYLWSGAEGEIVQGLIDEFNASQSQYVVNGLSVPDVQKIIVAVSSGEGPDITDNFSNNIATYATSGIIYPLDEFIARDEYDLSDFLPGALKSCQYEGKTYALPINFTTFMLFYNKALFAEAGLTEPPKTDKELLDYAVKLTKVNADSTLDVLGFPDYPFVYYTNNMAFAFGGEFISADDSTLTPDNSGTVQALELIRQYREKFGVDNVLKFNSAGAYMSATDPFIAGKQALRIDGPWMGTTLKKHLQIDLDYGVAPLPYPEGHSEFARGAEVSSSPFFITSTTKNKEGAWAFLKWLMAKEQMVKFCAQIGNMPARASVLKDPAFQDFSDFEAFAEQGMSDNLKVFPAFPNQIEYGQIINNEAELAANLKQAADIAMKNAAQKSQDLLE